MSLVAYLIGQPEAQSFDRFVERVEIAIEGAAGNACLSDHIVDHYVAATIGVRAYPHCCGEQAGKHLFASYLPGSCAEINCPGLLAGEGFPLSILEHFHHACAATDNAALSFLSIGSA